MKAFLAHSSTNKELVETVARELGRQYVIIDKWSFETGTEFAESIAKGLEESSVFVFFASRAALKSAWVDFEQNEALQRKVLKHIKRGVVFLLEPGLSAEDLPEWLQRGLVHPLTSAKAIAREIRYQIHKHVLEEHQPFFVGRTRELRSIQEALFPLSGEHVPRMLLLSGLGGIGRRTLAERVARDYLNLQRILPIEVEAGDGPKELAIKLADRLEIYSGRSGLEAIIAEIEKSSESKLFERIRLHLVSAAANSELVTFVDAGGALHDDGTLGEALWMIKTAIDAEQETFAAIVTNRRVDVRADRANFGVFERVDPLGADDVCRLLLSLSRKAAVPLSQSEAQELSEYVAGYPPAAYFVAQLMRRYGKDLILADKSKLVDFRADSFIRYLDRQVALGDARKQILLCLAIYSPLPLPVLGSVVGKTPAELGTDMTYLVDASLVLPDQNGNYHLSRPVIDAVGRFTGHLDVDHVKVATALQAFLQDPSTGEGEVRLDLFRVLYRAMVRAGLEGTENAIHLRSDLVRMLKEFYHSRDYERAVKWGAEAANADPDAREAREFYAKSLIRLSRYDEAKVQIEELAKRGHVAGAWFCRGFLERVAGRPDQALDHYAAARKEGMRGVAVLREMALCCYALERLGDAKKYLAEATAIERDNRFVIDLQIKVAMELGDESWARERLKALEGSDSRPFFLHRLSTVEAYLGNWVPACQAASRAVELEARPTFEMLSQLAKCQIETGAFAEAAETLRSLESKHGNTRKDIRIGLQCKLQIRQGRFDDALGLWSQLREKEKPVHLALRLETLKGILRTPGIGSAVAAGYRAEVSSLEKRVQQASRRKLEFAVD